MIRRQPMKKILFPLMLIVMLALAACGGNVDTQGLVESAQNVAEDVVDSVNDELNQTDEETTEVTPEETTEEPTPEPTEEPTPEPTIEVAEGESPIWAEIKSDTLRDPVVLAGVILDDASVTQQEGSVLLSAGFEFAFFKSQYLDDHPLLNIRRGEIGDALILNILTTALDDVFVPIAKSSETALGSVAVTNLRDDSAGYNHILVDIGRPNGAVMEGDLIEITLGDASSSEPPYYLTVYRGENRELIAEFQLVKK
jgi:hypothetical protein